MLFASPSTEICIPMEMKNIIMNTSFMGATCSSISFAAFLDWETMTPARNAPMAMDMPMVMER